MGRFFTYLFTFLFGGIVGIVAGGGLGTAAGTYIGACKVIDQAVTTGSLTQDAANTLVRSIANDLQISPDRKAQIIQELKKQNQPASPCATAIQAL
jgi:polyhydroxyalkanoate synthesis regulator phasin